MEFITGIIKPALLILIPFSWIVGIWLKASLSYQGGNWFARMVGRIVKDTSRLKVAIHLVIIATAIVIGFICSDLEGLRRVGDAVIIYGLHGIVCVWVASKLYDKVREQ